MTAPQHKIGSGFGARSTADDVLSGIDLSDLDSVRGFAERFLASGRQVDIVINSAGIMACPETRVGPGWEAQFATNHLGHYALVNLLWPAIVRGGARVVAVSSAGHGITGIRWDDVQFERGCDRWQAYGQAKTANVLFAKQLDALGRDAGVRAFAVHPGSILTPLQRHLAKEEMVGAGWIDEHGNPADPTFKTPGQGAATQVWAATSPDWRAWAAGTARTATSPSRPARAREAACTHTRQTPSRPRACGHCRPDPRASTRSRQRRSRRWT